MQLEHDKGTKFGDWGSGQALEEVALKPQKGGGCRESELRRNFQN